MANLQTPEQWLGKDPEKLKFVLQYLRKKTGIVSAPQFPFLGQELEDNETKEADRILAALKMYLSTYPSGYPFPYDPEVHHLFGHNSPVLNKAAFDRVRAAWNRAKHAKKHVTVLHSFYLDKKTDKDFRALTKRLKKTRSELIKHFVKNELEATASPLNIAALHQQINHLSWQKAEIEKKMELAFDEINQFVLELRIKEYEYEIVKKKLGADVDKIVEQHSRQIQSFTASSAAVPILKKMIVRRQKAKRKIIPLE